MSSAPAPQTSGSGTTTKGSEMSIDFSTVETTDQTIKVSRKSAYAESKLLAPLTKSFEDGLAGKPNVLRITVPTADAKEALAEIRGAIDVLDQAFQSESGEKPEGVRGVGKRVSSSESGDKTVILFAAVPKSNRGPKGPRAAKVEEEAVSNEPANEVAKSAKGK